MKNFLLFFTFSLFTFSSCSKSGDQSNTNNTPVVKNVILPTLSTIDVSSITISKGITGGNITKDGGGQIVSRGIVWSTSPNPTISLSTKSNDGTGTGSYVTNLDNLLSAVKYYIRAYATNSAGTAYGNEISFTTNDIKVGMVGYYPFTGNANDNSGNANNGIVTNAVLSQDRFGNLNSAYLFNGTTSNIRVPNSTTLKSSTYQLTISAWVQINQFTGNPKAGVIVDKSAGTTGDWGISYYDWDANPSVENLKFGAYVRGNGTVLVSGLQTKTVPTTGKWIHLLYSFDGNSNSNLYINGISEITIGNGGNPFSLWPNTQDLYIGRSGTANGTFYSITGSNFNYFNGAIDDIRIFNRALNEEEATYLFKH